MLLDRSACGVRLVVANAAMKSTVPSLPVATVTQPLCKSALNENIRITPAKSWRLMHSAEFLGEERLNKREAPIRPDSLKCKDGRPKARRLSRLHREQKGPDRLRFLPLP